jgi:hypothetical protein
MQGVPRQTQRSEQERGGGGESGQAKRRSAHRDSRQTGQPDITVRIPETPVLYSGAGAAASAPRDLMAAALPLRAALTRGAVITAANWPMVLVEFTLESIYRIALAVPVVGGAVMVAAFVGADVRVLFDEGLRSAAERVAASLDHAPVALGSFLAAEGLVALGGALVVFVIKAGTLSTLVAGDQVAGDVERGRMTMAAIRTAAAYDPGRVISAARTFARRVVVLTVGLTVAYALVGAAYLAALSGAHRLADSPWAPVWPLAVLLATSAGMVAVAIVNLAFDLLRVIIVTDDCGVGEALARMRRFVVTDARQVLGIFGSVGVVQLLATAASVLTTAGLAFVAWVPLAGVVSVPLRGSAWLIQGLLLQYVALTAVSAYQTQYRRFATPFGAAPRLLEPA